MFTLATLARLLTHLGVAIVVGNAMLALAGARANERESRRPVIVDIAWLSLAAGISLLLAAQLRDLELAFDSESLAELLLQTTWGHGWIALAASSLLAWLARPRRSRSAPVSRSVSWAALASVLFATCIAVATGGLGHAAADTEWPLLARVIDGAHVIGVGAWLGGLALVATTQPDSSRAAIDRWARYSALATIAAPVVVLSGLAASLRRLAGAEPSSIVTSDYGRLLLLKTALALLVLAMGAAHRRRVHRRMLPGTVGVTGELITALAVFLVTSVLTGTAPPGE